MAGLIQILAGKRRKQLSQASPGIYKKTGARPRAARVSSYLSRSSRGLQTHCAWVKRGTASARANKSVKRNSRKPCCLSGFRYLRFFVISIPLHHTSELASFSANRAQRPASVLTDAPVMAVNPVGLTLGLAEMPD